MFQLSGNLVHSHLSLRFRRVRHIFVPLSPEVGVLRGHHLDDVWHLEDLTPVVEVWNRPNKAFVDQNRF